MTDKEPVPLLTAEMARQIVDQPLRSGVRQLGYDDLAALRAIADGRSTVQPAAAQGWQRVMRDMWLAWRSGERNDDYGALNAEVESLLAAAPPAPTTKETPP